MSGIDDIKVKVYDLEQAKAKAVKDADAWRLAYDTLCTELAYTLGMDSPTVAGDHQVKARVRELMDESVRCYSQGVEDMRAKVANRIFADEQKCQAAINANPTNPHLSGRLRGLQRARDIVTGPAPDTCISRSTFGRSDTLTCELPSGHQGLHRSGDGMWTDDGADKEPAPAPDLASRVAALEADMRQAQAALRGLGKLTDSRAARRGRRI